MAWQDLHVTSLFLLSVCHRWNIFKKAFTTQSEQINVVVSDRNWLERENNIKSATLIRLNETNIEYQRYLHQREAAMAIELGKQQQIQKEQN